MDGFSFLPRAVGLLHEFSWSTDALNVLCALHFGFKSSPVLLFLVVIIIVVAFTVVIVIYIYMYICLVAYRNM